VQLLLDELERVVEKVATQRLSPSRAFAMCRATLPKKVDWISWTRTVPMMISDFVPPASTFLFLFSRRLRVQSIRSAVYVTVTYSLPTDRRAMLWVTKELTSTLGRSYSTVMRSRRKPGEELAEATKDDQGATSGAKLSWCRADTLCTRARSRRRCFRSRVNRCVLVAKISKAGLPARLYAKPEQSGRKAILVVIVGQTITWMRPRLRMPKDDAKSKL
jgi:hypothetical protein